jgi:hypothetical protein
MKRSFVRFNLAVLALALALPSGDAEAQVTTAAVSGTVTGPSGEALAAAQVSVTNTTTGFATGALSNSDGRFFVSFLQPGGPYVVRVELLGYGTETREGIQLSLGQNLRLDFQLRQQALEVEGIIVETDPVFSANRTGQETKISEEQIAELPTISRNFTELATLSPLAASNGDAVSVGGANNRFNSIRIDGATSNDVFGLADSGVPGGQANGKPISQDAIAEFQVLAAPFDVRQSGFTGGLINAVTKSGSNEWTGSLYGFFRNQSLQRGTLTVDGREFDTADFSRGTFGGTLGGPLVRDKLHFFLSGEYETRDNPLSLGAESGAGSLGMDPESIERVGLIATGNGLAFGRVNAYTLANPALNLFGRLDWSINTNHSASFKYTYASADNDDSPSRGGGFFEPESATYDFENTTNSLVGQLFSRFGEWDNEILVNFQFIRDRRAPADEFQYSTHVVDVPDDPINDGATVRFGAERFSHANALDQDVLQLTDNLSRFFGDHRVTFGVNAEYWTFANLFVDQSLGEYGYDSVQDYETGNIDSYFIRLLHPDFAAGAPIEAAAAEFGYWQVGGYAQDAWDVSYDVTLTLGLRVDVPFTSDSPRDNPDFEDDFGRSTTQVPSGNPLFQPRFGFNWRVSGDARNQIRGGTGLFAGRLPFVWMSNAFGNTGRESVRLSCFGSNAPAYNPNDPPETCADGSGAAAARASVNVVDPDFKFPTEWKINLAWDKEWGAGWRTTFEGLYSKSINAIVTQEINSSQTEVSGGNRAGMGDRLIFGTPTSFRGDDPWSPVLVSGDFLDVVEMTNSSRGYTYQLIGELAKTWDRHAVTAAYTYSRSYDIMSMTSSRAISNYGFNPFGASPYLEDRPVTASNFDTPHRIIVTAQGTYLPQYGGTTISAIYRGRSGVPYQYVYDGDINGDGYAGAFSSSRTNDLVYIPAASSEITWRTADDERLFNEMVALDTCLSDAQGSILERNSCRNPFVHVLDVRLIQGFDLPTGRFELLVDFFNFLNLLNNDWGVVEATPNNTVQLLRTRGRVDDDPAKPVILSYDGFRTTDDGGTSRAVLPYSVRATTSKWKINLGMRYLF